MGPRAAPRPSPNSPKLPETPRHSRVTSGHQKSMKIVDNRWKCYENRRNSKKTQAPHQTHPYLIGILSTISRVNAVESACQRGKTPQNQRAQDPRQATPRGRPKLDRRPAEAQLSSRGVDSHKHAHHPLGGVGTRRGDMWRLRLNSIHRQESCLQVSIP